MESVRAVSEGMTSSTVADPLGALGSGALTLAKRTYNAVHTFNTRVQEGSKATQTLLQRIHDARQVKDVSLSRGDAPVLSHNMTPLDTLNTSSLRSHTGNLSTAHITPSAPFIGAFSGQTPHYLSMKQFLPILDSSSSDASKRPVIEMKHGIVQKPQHRNTTPSSTSVLGNNVNGPHAVQLLPTQQPKQHALRSIHNENSASHEPQSIASSHMQAFLNEIAHLKNPSLGPRARRQLSGVMTDELLLTIFPEACVAKGYQSMPSVYSILTHSVLYCFVLCRALDTLCDYVTYGVHSGECFLHSSPQHLVRAPGFIVLNMSCAKTYLPSLENRLQNKLEYLRHLFSFKLDARSVFSMLNLTNVDNFIKKDRVILDDENTVEERDVMHGFTPANINAEHSTPRETHLSSFLRGEHASLGDREMASTASSDAQNIPTPQIQSKILTQEQFKRILVLERNFREVKHNLAQRKRPVCNDKDALGTPTVYEHVSLKECIELCGASACVLFTYHPSTQECTLRQRCAYMGAMSSTFEPNAEVSAIEEKDILAPLDAVQLKKNNPVVLALYQTAQPKHRYLIKSGNNDRIIGAPLTMENKQLLSTLIAFKLPKPVLTNNTSLLNHTPVRDPISVAPQHPKRIALPEGVTGEPSVSCYNVGMRCCVPYGVVQKVSGIPPSLEGKLDAQCRAEYIPRLNNYCVTMVYGSHDCAQIVVATKDSKVYRARLMYNIRPSPINVICECTERTRGNIPTYKKGSARWVSPITTDVASRDPTDLTFRILRLAKSITLAATTTTGVKQRFEALSKRVEQLAPRLHGILKSNRDWESPHDTNASSRLLQRFRV